MTKRFHVSTSCMFDTALDTPLLLNYDRKEWRISDILLANVGIHSHLVVECVSNLNHEQNQSNSTKLILIFNFLFCILNVAEYSFQLEFNISIKNWQFSWHLKETQLN